MADIIIAIDGHSACGKSTTARKVAAKLGYVYVDSGAMYRVVTYSLLKNKIALDDLEQVQAALANMKIDFKLDEHGAPITFLNGNSVENAIREMKVSENVSQVAALSMVRREMVYQQRLLGLKKGIVMDGRDIGTVVFPDAELKIFMTADPVIRAERRLKELELKGIKISLSEVMLNISERDHKDTSRDDSPLRQADDAIVIDNSHLTFNEQVDQIILLAKKIIEA